MSGTEKMVTEAVCQEYGVSSRMIATTSRKAPLPECRRMIKYALYYLTNMTHENIAKGMSVHVSYVRYQINQVADEYRLYETTKNHYKNIKINVEKSKNIAQ